MGRTATNVIGNAVASAVVAKWEGGFDARDPATIEPPHAPSGGGPAHPVTSLRDVVTARRGVRFAGRGGA